MNLISKRNFLNYSRSAKLAGFLIMVSACGYIQKSQASGGQLLFDTTYENPAWFVLVPNGQMVLDATLVDLNISVTGISNTVPSGGIASAYSHTVDVLPYGKFVKRISKKLVFGLVLSQPTLTHVAYASDSLVNADVIKYHDHAFALSPSLAYQLTDKIAVGVGVDIYSQQTNFTSRFSPTQNYQYNLHDVKPGWHLGFLFTLPKDTYLGLSYFSQGQMLLHGYDSIDEVGVSYAVTGAYNIPDVARGLISHTFNKKWDGFAFVDFEHWSIYQNFHLQNSILNQLGLPTNTPTQFINAWQFGAGATYHVNDKWSLLGTAVYCTPPEPNNTLQPYLFETNSIALQPGVQYEISKKISLQMKYTAWVMVKPITFNNNILFSQFKGSGFIMGNLYEAKLTYNF